MQYTAPCAKSTTLVCEDADLPLLQFLCDNPAPKALLIVLQTGGSTPVKSGAMMAVDRHFRTAGTIGGCSEHAALLQAHRLIGSGAQRCVHVDLSNDVAADEGMVCGGQMDVLILTDGVAAQEAGI